MMSEMWKMQDISNIEKFQELWNKKMLILRIYLVVINFYNCDLKLLFPQISRILMIVN